MELSTTVGCITWTTGHCQMDPPPSYSMTGLSLIMVAELELTTRIAVKVSGIYLYLESNPSIGNIQVESALSVVSILA